MMTARSISPENTLDELLKGLGIPGVCPDISINGIATDSRNVKPGDLFIAHAIGGRGSMPYINDAVRAGASAVIAEADALPESVLCSVPLLRVEDLYKKIGIIADRFYNQPSSRMIVIGVTGTNGKTTIAHLLAESLSMEGTDAGLIGTLGYGQVGHLIPGRHTTPEAVALHELLADLRDRRIKRVVMEVSSHALEQYRIAGVKFDLAIFTNLTRDHLDYHGSMEAYAAAKRRLFFEYGIKRAVINMDDLFGRKLIEELPADVQIIAYTLDAEKYHKHRGGKQIVWGEIIDDPSGRISMQLKTPWGTGRLNTRLVGRFNALNILASLSALCQLDVPFEDVVSRLSRCSHIPGRMETFEMQNNAQVIVDYAHTPDALEQVLTTLREMCRGRLICVFGCGGDRDQGKRPLMGAVAEKYADRIIITNDNPRQEDPHQIIKDILGGIKNHHNVTIEVDRTNAISSAIRGSGNNDVVLIAGKGHENYQEIKGARRPFSDQAVVRSALGIAP